MTYLVDHLRGAHPIWLSFWVNGVVVRLLSYSLISFVLLGSPLSALIALSLFSFDVLLLVWQGVGYFKAAEATLRETGSMLPIWGGMLALIIAIFVGMSQWWALSLATRSLSDELPYSERMAMARQAAYSIDLDPDGTTAVFRGEIVFGTTKALAGILDERPEIHRLSLESVGGHIFEARGLAKLVADRGLSTHVDTSCSSACALVFLAGKSRSLAASAKLGFHSYSLEQANQLPGFDVHAEQERDREFMRARGVARDFAEKVFDTAPEQIWYPDHEALRAAGILTQVK